MISIPVENKTVIHKSYGGVNSDIISALLSDFSRAVQQTKGIASQFRGYTPKDTARNVWDFLKKNIRYVEDDDTQEIKLPSAFLDRKTGDCKSYSLFASSILFNNDLPVKFRFASYDPKDATPTHVYVVSGDTIVDGVWHSFDSEKPYEFKQDYPMRIQTISGTGERIRRRRLASSVPIGDYVLDQMFRGEPSDADSEGGDFLLVAPTTNNNNYLPSVLSDPNVSSRPQTQQQTPNTGGATTSNETLHEFTPPNDPRVPWPNWQHYDLFAKKNDTQRDRYINDFLKYINDSRSEQEMNDREQDLRNNFKFLSGEFRNKGRFQDAAVFAFNVVKTRVDDIVNALKKVFVAGPRGAFLGLVALNFKAFATDLNRMIEAGKEDKIKAFWEKLGGNYSRLKDAINDGKKRKMIGAIRGDYYIDAGGRIGAEPISMATLMTLATPLIIAALKFINDWKKEKDAAEKKAAEAEDEDEDDEDDDDDESGEPDHENDHTTGDDKKGDSKKGNEPTKNEKDDDDDDGKKKGGIPGWVWPAAAMLLLG